MTEPVLWRPADWRATLSLSRTTMDRLIARGEVETVKIGRARRIVTPPEAFIAERLKRQAGDR